MARQGILPTVAPAGSRQGQGQRVGLCRAAVATRADLHCGAHQAAHMPRMDAVMQQPLRSALHMCHISQSLHISLCPHVTQTLRQPHPPVKPYTLLAETFSAIWRPSSTARLKGSCSCFRSALALQGWVGWCSDEQRYTGVRQWW